MTQSLDDGYRAMAGDIARENEISGLKKDRRFRSQVAEVINRNLLVTELLKIGFNAYLPVYDRGVDLIAYRDADGAMRPIQLKGRWIIDQKYIGLSIWVAFPDAGDWYVAPHDEMVAIGEVAGFCTTSSWIEGGAYSCPGMSRSLKQRMGPFRLGHSTHFAPEI